MDASNRNKIAEFGAKWAEAGATKIYFRNLHVYLGLKFSFGETGLVDAATLDGKEIPLIDAQVLRAKLAMASFWFDFNLVTFGYSNIDSDTAEKLFHLITLDLVES